MRKVECTTSKSGPENVPTFRAAAKLVGCEPAYETASNRTGNKAGDSTLEN